MIIRILAVAALVAAGVALGAFSPHVSDTLRTAVLAAGLFAQPASWTDGHQQKGGKDAHQTGRGHGGGHGHGHGHGGEKESPEGSIKMPAERMTAAKIELAPVTKGTLARRLTVPGTVAPDADRIARVAAKVVGTVAALNKRLGDNVTKEEVVAVLESREVAEAKSEYLAAVVNLDLQKTLFERQQSLWDKGISAEQQLLRARTTYTEAQLRRDLARQKLSALSLKEKEVTGLSQQSVEGLQRYDLRSPIDGRVVERRVDLGAPVGGDGQEKEIYIIADLSTVWIELAVPPSDLPAIKEGQRVSIAAGSNGDARRSDGRIVFISPILNADTRQARVIAAVDNADMAWRPGSYVSAHVTVEEKPVDIRVPRAALQTIAGERVVFVRTEQGFEKREVVLGDGDDEAVELVFGVDPGETVAVSNSFVLKAELGKAEAEHAH